MEEKALINDNIRKEDIKKVVSEKTALHIDSIEENKPVFDINNIEGMSLSELKGIRDSIHQYASTESNADETNEEKRLTKVLKYKNK